MVNSVGDTMMDIFLLIGPMSSLVTLFQVYGVSLVVIGVMDLGLLLYLKKKIVIK